MEDVKPDVKPNVEQVRGTPACASPPRRAWARRVDSNTTNTAGSWRTPSLLHRGTTLARARTSHRFVGTTAKHPPPPPPRHAFIRDDR